MADLTQWPDWAAAIAAGALALIPGAALAWLLRAARPSGGAAWAAVLGGILAGVLVGPGVLGRVAPEAHAAMLVGASNERDTRQRLAREHAIELAVMRSSGVTPQAVGELAAQHEREMAPLRDAEARATAQRAEAIAWAGVGIAAGSLALVYLVGGGATSRRPIEPAQRLLARTAGILSVALPVGACALALHWLVGLDGRTGAAFGAAAAAGWAAPGVRARRMGREARSAMTDRASSAAMATGMLGAGVVVRSVALVVGAVPALIGLRRMGVSRPSRRVRRALHAALYGLLAPGLCAAAAMRIDPYQLLGAGGAALWIVLAVGAVASTDGRWLGAVGGWAAVSGGKGLAAPMERATAQMASGVGVAQCGLAFALHAFGGVDDALILALLAGAALAECSVGVYRLFTREAEKALGADAGR